MYRIKNVAVIGSGTMGSGIACHLANAGFSVLLLDMVPRELNEEQTKLKKWRNSLVDNNLAKAIKSKPAPLYSGSFRRRIETGNLEDDLVKIVESDWIIEVIVENLEIKRHLLERVDNHRKSGSLVTSNTSSIPIHQMAEGRSEDFRAHFLGTHFFNPPRYLPLLEVIPTADTSSDVVDFFLEFGQNFLGKQTVLCKDTAAFIGNRIGVFAMAVVYRLTSELGLSIDEVDKLTGPALARPNTGTFRLTDLVGLDVAAKVMDTIRQNAPDDDMVQDLAMPDFFHHLLEHGFLGNKTGQGFYKKTDQKNDKGKSVILGLNLQTKEYEHPGKSSLSSLQLSKQTEDPKKRIQKLWRHEDAGGQLIKRSLAYLFSYASLRVPEISDDIFWIDKAVKAGFAWEYGPFEYWDIIGLDAGIEAIQEEGLEVADWVLKMKEQGVDSFYKVDDSKLHFYDTLHTAWKEVPGIGEFYILDHFRDHAPVYQNDELKLHDIGDGVLCAEFTSKMNAIGEGILSGLMESIRIAEEGDWKGLVIGNNAKNFSVGANLMLIGMLAFQQEYDQLNMAVRLFQDTSMKCRYSKIPVVAATQGYVFGGGCELSMHCDSIVAAAESYIGLVEAGVGLIPGGGGSKEFAVRASDDFVKDGVYMPQLIERFRTIAMAQVATSAYEAIEYGYLNHKDQVSIHSMKNIAMAKERVLDLSSSYVPETPRDNVYVLGRSGLATLQLAANELYRGGYASEHDIKIASKLAFVLCGGDLSEPQYVSEQYLLDIEREAFLSLCGEQKTLERIQYMLENNKPLRN